MNHDAQEDFLFSQIFQGVGMSIAPDMLLEHHAKTREIMCKSARLDTAEFFGAMLLDERLQSNCVRLEALVHLAIAVGSGTQMAAQARLAECFNDLGNGICGQMEDPAEDVFVSLVTTSQGNFRVLQGIWESGTFYLQRILDIVESLPNDELFVLFRRQVFALLKLSEEVCERSGLSRYCVGERNPRRKITRTYCSWAKRNLVLFDHDDLTQLGIIKEDLEGFIFEDCLISHVLSEPIDNSTLQRFPIIDGDNHIALILPTAISFAVRYAVVDFLLRHGLHRSLQINLADHYAVLFNGAHLLGSITKAPIYFSHKDEFPIAVFVTDADKGRYLNFVFFTDSLCQFYDTGISGTDPTPAAHVDMLKKSIDVAIEYVNKKSDYVSGITLLIYCGIGRGVAMPIPKIDKERWDVQFLTAADLFTLSRSDNFTALKLWKVLDGVERLRQLGVTMIGPNDLFNTIALIDSNEGHLVSPSQVPKEFRKFPGGLLVASNYVLEFRHDIAIKNDRHGAYTVDGNMVAVRRITESFFPEDRALPIYV